MTNHRAHAKNQKLSAEVARELLIYVPETGKLYWKERPIWLCVSESDQKRWNSRFAGSEAFTATCRHGYRHGLVFGVKHKAHRVAWLLQTGSWPDNAIDHLNGNRSDNRIENLREATFAENGRNQKIKKNNTSGVNGVSLDAASGRWRARIKVNGRDLNLGYFNSVDEAASAREVANDRFGYSRRHGT